MTSFAIRSSLGTRILLLVGGTAAASTLFALLAVYLITLSQGQRMVEDNTRATAILANERLSDRQSSLLALVNVMASQPTFVSYVLLNPSANEARQDWDTVSETATQAGEKIGADAVLLTDASGHSIGEYIRRRWPRPAQGAVAQHAPAAHPDYHSEPGFAEMLTGDPDAPGQWKGFVVRRGRLFAVARVSIYAPGTAYVRGTLSAYSAIDAAMAGDIAKASRCDVAFVRGTVVYGSSVATPDGPLDLATGSRVDLNGNRYVASEQTLAPIGHGEPLKLLVLYPLQRASALPRRLEGALAILFPFTLLLALIASAAVSRSLARPLDAVVAAAKTLQGGGWPERFASARADEIGLLQNVFDDMSLSLRSAQERLLSLIDIDTLTELDNHRRFQERLAQETERAAASGEPLSLLLIDIDHFHTFNQRAGHAAGDEMVKRIAAVLRATLPPLALAARFGGEEFSVLLPRMGTVEAGRVAESVRENIKSESLGIVTVSIGYAVLRADDSSPEGLTLAAELALSQAKQLGRDRCCAFDSLSNSGTNPDSGDFSHLYRFLKDGSLATIQALAAAVDAKDPYTRGHSQRVAESAAALARYAGLSPADVDLVYTTGTLHDAGKIGVPDRILQKEGRLDDDERALMETHPVLGEVIVGKVPSLAATLGGVRSHHERWDGRGYPDGLAGEEIPLIARILALADTFDAMTSDRPYRNGLPAARALDEIARCAGTQFDPELARAFIECRRANGEAASVLGKPVAMVAS